MSTLKNTVKKVVPFSTNVIGIVYKLKGLIKKPFEKWYYIRKSATLQKKKLYELHDKKKIKCVFLVFNSSCFRDYLYKLLTENERFDVIVVVCPIYSHSQEYKDRRLVSTYNDLMGRGYKNIVMGYDIEKDISIDIAKTYNPDIVIYTNPYRSLIGEKNYVTNFKDALTIYIPYYINNTVEYKNAYDELLHNVVWRYYVETEWHNKLSLKYSSNNGRNVVVTGYSGMDLLLDKNYCPTEDPWKIKDRSVKRIIWAPHQTIDPTQKMYYSAFLFIAEGMVEIAKKYKNEIQIAFKPHPLLIKNLYKEWGKEKTDTYYELWNSMENTCIIDGGYIDLFLTSDAIIHDSASFITEYLVLDKPSLRTCNGRDLRSQFNDFSLACLDYYYKANDIKGVENFIINVIKEVDPLKEKRSKFIKDSIMSPLGKLPSENIVDDILDSIDNQILYRK